MTASGASALGPIPYLKRASLRTFDHTFKPAVLFGASLVVGQDLGQPTPGSRAALHLCCHSRCASPTGRACPWWGTKRPTKLSPTSLKQSEQNQSLLMEPKALEKSARRVRACSTYPSRSHPAPGNGKTARESARQIPACSRLSQEPKSAGDLARQIQPLPSRSRRCLDYETSGSPSPSRSYRRPETESLQVTEFSGCNLSHARPGAGRALVGNGETCRAQSKRIQPCLGHGQPAGG